ncbi:MAG TPA: hypothetical protein PK313_17015, partial [Myxococcota bacterium]|nr:hypothetical protein [Myxococcota bacterium]
WDEGAFNVEWFLGYDGMGHPGIRDRSTTTEFMVGYGIRDDLGLYVPLAIETDGAFGSPLGSVAIGLFGTPVDTRFFDLDLFLEVGTGGAGFREWGALPYVELNFDGHPERLSWGFFVQAGMPIRGRPDASGGLSGATFDVSGLLGAYWRPHPDHELVLEFDTLLHPIHGADHARRAEIGGLALGYNVVLNDTAELLAQVSADIPQGRERWAFGATLGVILTLPGPGAKRAPSHPAVFADVR